MHQSNQDQYMNVLMHHILQVHQLLLVKCDALERSYIGLDYFDASINRICALVIGARNMEKALLKALLTPWNTLSDLQNSLDHTKVLYLQEVIKTLPWNEVWDEYCKECGVLNEEDWYKGVLKYEEEVLSKRGM